MDMIHQEIPDTILIRISSHISKSDVLIHTLKERVGQPPVFPRQKAEPGKHAKDTKIESVAEKKDDEVLDSLRSETKSSLEASDYDSKAWCEQHRRNKLKSR